MEIKDLEGLLKTGRECPMQVPSEMQTWCNILRQLGTAYVGSSLDALKEYISNASDAGAKNIVISLKRKGGKNSISISDDGQGMYLPKSEEAYIDKPASEYDTIALQPDSILRLTKSIGNSAKKLDTQKQGSKAIGALAWQTIGNSVMFLSKKEDEEPVAWTCRYDRVGSDHNYTSRIVTSKDNPSLEGVISGRGTTVFFEDVNSEVMRELSAVRIKKDFGSRFRDLIKDKGVKITIQDGKEKYFVEPEEYQGNPVVAESVNTKYGPIQFEIYFNPNKKGCVHVKRGIQTLIEDVSVKGNLGSRAWSSGAFVGQIRADWLLPGAGHLDVENNDKSVAFYQAVRKYNKQLDEKLDSYHKENSKAQKRSMYNTMTKAFNAMLGEYPELMDLLLGYRTSKIGESITGKVKDGVAPVNPIDPGDSDKEPRGKNPDRKKGEDSDIQPGTPAEPGLEGKVKARKCFTVTFNDDVLPGHIMSDFDDQHSLITFNNTHKAYLQAIENPETRRMYLTALVGKELLSRVYKEPVELADRVIEFQQVFLRYFRM